MLHPFNLESTSFHAILNKLWKKLTWFMMVERCSSPEIGSNKQI
jgi:hypothetical protein